MTVYQLIKALRKVKINQKSVRITDKEGSFDEELFAVEEDPGAVRLVINTAKL